MTATDQDVLPKVPGLGFDKIVALLASVWEEGKTQTEIASRLSKSNAAISRAVKALREHGLLKRIQKKEEQDDGSFKETNLVYAPVNDLVLRLCQRLNLSEDQTNHIMEKVERDRVNVSNFRGDMEAFLKDAKDKADQTTKKVGKGILDAVKSSKSALIGNVLLLGSAVESDEDYNGFVFSIFLQAMGESLLSSFPEPNKLPSTLPPITITPESSEGKPRAILDYKGLKDAKSSITLKTSFESEDD